MSVVALPGLRSRGLTWSVLTTHRTAVRLWAGFLALAVTGMVALHFFGEHVQAATALCGSGSASCPPEVVEQESLYRRLLEAASKGVLYVPVVVAAFAGASLTGREMETGTARLAWTQSVSPARWLTAKLTVPAVLLTGGMVLLTLLYRWVRTSGGQAAQEGFWGWPNIFPATGPTGTAYVLFALVAGAVAGLLARRQLAALAVGASATVLCQILGHAARPRLWPTETATGPRALEGLADPMLVDSGVRTPSGEPFSFGRCFSAEPPLGVEGCMEKYDLERYVVYHPASHYWPMQLMETGILLAVTAVLTALAYRLLRRRTA